MDPLLPFRALSPGTGKSKIAPRNRNNKLCLRLRKQFPVLENGKENEPPTTTDHWRKRDSNLTDSDLMTSDESNLSGSEDTPNLRRNSALTLNSQTSTFSLPIAESTRCEVPLKNTIEHVKSTSGTLHAANSKCSSVSSEYFSACPLPVGCDDSIVYISDSSPEPPQKLISKVSSVLLTTDESDTESQTNYLHQNVLSRIGKGKPKQLCETVILETSHSEDSDDSFVDNRPECGVVIPPSIKSDNGSCSDTSAASGVGPTSSKMHLNADVAPTVYNKNCEASPKVISEKGDFGKKPSQIKRGNQDHILVSSCRVNRTDEGLNGDICSESDPLNLSWKADFQLAPQESSGDSKELSDSNGITLKSTEDYVPISKEKYNDIARWLFSGNHSPGSSLGSPSHPAKDSHPTINSNTEATAVTADLASREQKHPQIRRYSIVKRSSFSSESDDNFDAFIDSVRKKKSDYNRKGNSNIDKDDSFIHDTSDNESPSPNVYHSDLTKSIRKEVKSVQKSAKRMQKKYYSSYSRDSSDESDKEQPGSPVLKPAGASNINFESGRRLGITYSEDSDSEPSIQQKSTEMTFSDYADFDPKLPKSETFPTKNNSVKDIERSKLPPLQTSCTRKGKRGKDTSKKCQSVSESSDSSSSDPKAPSQARIPLWRREKNLHGSSSTSSTSSYTQEDPEVQKEENIPTKPFKKPIGVRKCLPVGTPQRVTALKSPHTPYSPMRTFLSSLSGPSHKLGVRDHPEASVYNNNFKGKKEELTCRLFKLFNREVFDHKLPSDLLVEWNSRLARTAGLCYCKLLKKAGETTRTAKIALSTKVITSPDRLRDTLIHEMCHAAVWILNNVSGGHGQFWKAWAHRAMKRFPELPPIQRCHSYKIETKFTYKCTKCGYSFGRHSKSLDVGRKRCGYCYGEFEVFLSAKGQDQNKILKTPKAPNAFALFVKENYGLMKQENGLLKHGDVMKKLSENFAAMKVKVSES